MIYVIVPLPAFWLVAWHCMGESSCAAVSLMSHLSSSSLSPLPCTFAQQP